jgi:hypothetical protein
MAERKLLVLGCSQTKLDAPGLLPAINRYDGSPYRVLRNYLRQQDWPEELSVAILSAKYGLIGGITGIENYDERMTPEKATAMAPKCRGTLLEWASDHSRFYFSLGKDYLPAVMPTIQSDLENRTKIFDGPIGMKLYQIKDLLGSIDSHPRRKYSLPEPGTGEIKYFLPDWDDLLDNQFDFRTDTFSGDSRDQRNDLHCSVLMKPKRMCDGILVSLAQHITSKGPLRRINGTESLSLAPRNLRSFFGLDNDQLLFGDSGAFSYANEDSPTITIEQAISLYEINGFDFGASVDHIPFQKVERNGSIVDLTREERLNRVKITAENAQQFIDLAKKWHVSFTPVGSIHGLNAKNYAEMAALYHELGYRHIAIGGLVPQSDEDVRDIVTQVMKAVAQLKPRPWIHLFGIFRPKLQELFRELKIDSFDSATYFRKAWLRSDQNYLAKNGKWYAAIRVPMTKDGRTRKELEESGFNISDLEREESRVMKLLCDYDHDVVGIDEVLEAVINYDKHLIRSSDVRSLIDKYKRTLEDKPWRICDCPFCRNTGIHTLIFRGANRNKRRGAHNTLMLYEHLKE